MDKNIWICRKQRIDCVPSSTTNLHWTSHQSYLWKQEITTRFARCRHVITICSIKLIKKRNVIGSVLIWAWIALKIQILIFQILFQGMLIFKSYLFIVTMVIKFMHSSIIWYSHTTAVTVKQPYRINGITNKARIQHYIPLEPPSFLHPVPMFIRYQTNISFMYVHYGNIGWLLFLYVYLKVFPPFFIQVVPILEELSKYKDTN